MIRHVEIVFFKKENVSEGWVRVIADTLMEVENELEHFAAYRAGRGGWLRAREAKQQKNFETDEIFYHGFMRMVLRDEPGDLIDVPEPDRAVFGP